LGVSPSWVDRIASKLAPQDHIVRSFRLHRARGTDRMTYLPELLKALSQVVKQGRPSSQASRSPAMRHSRLVVPAISRLRIIDNSLVNVEGISPRNIIKVQEFDSPLLSNPALRRTRLPVLVEQIPTGVRVTAGARTPAQMVTPARRHRGGSGRPHAINDPRQDYDLRGQGPPRHLVQRTYRRRRLRPCLQAWPRRHRSKPRLAPPYLLAFSSDRGVSRPLTKCRVAAGVGVRQFAKGECRPLSRRRPCASRPPLYLRASFRLAPLRG